MLLPAPTSRSRGVLRETIASLRGPMLAAAFFSAVINILMLGPPLYMLQVYDRVLNSRSESTLLSLTLILLLTLAVMGTLEAVRSRVLVRISSAFDRNLSGGVFDRIFAPEIRLLGQHRSRPLSDLNQIRQFMTGSAFFAFFDVIWIPIYVGVLFLIHPLLGWLTIAAIIILFALAIAQEFMTRKRLLEASAAQTKGVNFVESSLRNGDVLDAMGMLGHVRDRWRRFHAAMLQRQAEASDRAGALSGASKFCMVFVQSLLLGAGALLAIEGLISPGMMIAGSIIGSKALQPVQLVVGQWQGFVQARQAWTRLDQMLATTPAAPRPMRLPTPKGHLSAHQIVAAPPNVRVPVIKGVSLDLAPGDLIAIVGPSGAGKSTLARALTGVWPIMAGEVRLDGALLTQYPRDQLGEAIGYLPQDVELFEGTVAENIARLGTVDAEAVVRAAQLVEAHDMILRLPHGYNTQVGEGGRLLSGGQRQRIGLARAVYGDPVLCVFDEPNSNLDDSGEAHLASALRKLKDSGRAALVISHRPSLLNHVDKVMVLREGQVAFLGPRQEAFARFAKPAAVSQAAG